MNELGSSRYSHYSRCEYHERDLVRVSRLCRADSVGAVDSELIVYTGWISELSFQHLLFSFRFLCPTMFLLYKHMSDLHEEYLCSSEGFLALALQFMKAMHLPL